MDNNKNDLGNVVLVDANAFVHKSFHGYVPIMDRSDRDQRVLTGLMQAIYDVVKNVDRISYLYMVFDAADSSLYRKSVYPLYKENRPPTPPELVAQRLHAKKVLKDEVGIPILEYPGFEADDMIGSLAHHYKATHNVIVVSPDKDLFQLVDDKTIILRPTKKNNKKVYEYITHVGVDKYFGVVPAQIPDYLSLVGDSSDNLPGIDRLGAKTAAYLLKKYSSIDKIHVVIDDLIRLEPDYAVFLKEIKEKIDTVRLVRHLATIKTDLDIKKYIEVCLNCANEIQSRPTYQAKLEIVAHHYNWKPHFISVLR